jgi:hypothetical protein
MANSSKKRGPWRVVKTADKARQDDRSFDAKD